MSKRKPRRYAEGTTVEVERSKMQIEELMRKHGATQFLNRWDLIRCFFGSHHWGYSRDKDHVGRSLRRKCMRCRKRQHRVVMQGSRETWKG